MKLRVTILLVMLFLSLSILAKSGPQINTIYRGDDLSQQKLSDVVNAIPLGSIIIVSEVHDNESHHSKQIEFLQTLGNSTPSPIHVGMEFFDYTTQNDVDLYIQGHIEEQEFLKRVNWGATSFDFYKKQVFFPTEHSSKGKTLALNAPRNISSKIAKSGLDSLDPEQRRLLPPQFRLGNAKYFERFKEVMSGHVSHEQLLRYFAAQSLWDDTMAWKASEFIKNNPLSLLVIFVGDFHVIYGGGLPDRIFQRGVQNVFTFSQIELEDSNPDQWKELEPDPNYGIRSDWIWTSSAQ